MWCQHWECMTEKIVLASFQISQANKENGAINNSISVMVDIDLDLLYTL